MSVSTTVIELNQGNADQVLANGNYIVNSPQITTIYDGDTVITNIVSIDSNTATSDTIVIENDEKISATFSIFDVDYDKTDKRVNDNSAAWQAGGAATFQVYAAYNGKNVRKFDSCTVTINGYQSPYKTGQPGRLAGGSFLVNDSTTDEHGNPINPPLPEPMIFYANCQFTKPDGTTGTGKLTGQNTAYGTPPGLEGGDPLFYATGSSLTMTVPAGDPQIEFMSGTFKITGYEGEWPDSTTFPYSGSVYPGDPNDNNPDRVPVQGSQFSFDESSIVSTIISAGGTQLDIQQTSVTLPAGEYDPTSLAVTLTQLLSNGKKIAGGAGRLVPSNPFLQRTDEDDNFNLVFRRVDFTADPNQEITFDNSNTYVYQDAAGTRIPYFVGATAFAIEYGKAGDSFQLSYAHMPVYNHAEPGKQNVALYWNGAPDTYFWITRSSGIVIHDLQPQSFWQDQLGLYEQLIVPLQTDKNGIKYYLLNDLENSTPEGFVSLGAYMLPDNNPFRKMAPIPPSGAGTPPIYVDSTGITKAIIGSPKSGSIQGGSTYLIDIQGLTPKGVDEGYLANVSMLPSIQSVVTRQYDSSNITGFDEGAIPYVHKGAPYTISKFHVKILDTNSKQLAPVGPDNVVFIKIIRAQQSIPNVLPAPKEAKDNGDKEKTK